MIATHYNVDFSEHYLAPYFARRGIGFLGWNTRYRGFEDQFLLEHAVIDIGVGMDWLRAEAGVEAIVILGNSGGGSLMGAYQAEAIAPTLTDRLPAAAQDALGALRKGDLYVSFNAHQGRPEVLTDWMDASVTDETDPVATDPALDPFNPDNGPPYSAEFQATYRAAQRARNQRITDWAKVELQRLNAAGIPDRLFPMFRCWGDIRCIDPVIDPSDRAPGQCYRGDPRIANRTPSIGRVNTIKTWLNMWSLETSPCRGAPHLAKFDTPALVVQGMGDTGVFPSDARAIFEFIGSVDKRIELIAGAHYFEDLAINRENAADLVTSWIREKL
ncbi:hypothetical protein GCM10011529_07670 [Polymorphobacter glacialis]|uniref:Alpha/beta hydrolase n=1 Tax=Sandarakinorhabdus glacialis TaxID=1614636 RepID=A0A917E4U1_9SPHN|nr:hypothetical protein GCM10011529_07670 [Polymorphobacter glacialis]